MAKSFSKSLFFIIIVLIFPSCKDKLTAPKKDYSFEYVNLNVNEIDSIYNSRKNDIVFLSFYPGMHYDIYTKYLKKEEKYGDLFSGIDDKGLRIYLFELDSSKTKKSWYSSKNAIDLIISMEENSVNLTSNDYINASQYKMAEYLYIEKYGLPKDTIIANKNYLLFEKNDKLITFDTDKNSIFTIKYWTKKSIENYIKDYQEEIQRKELRQKKFNKRKSKKEKVLEKI